MPYNNETAQRYAGLGLEVFQRRNRELLASFDGVQVTKTLVAWTRLHKLDDLRNHITTAEPEIEFWADHLERGFLSLYDESKLSHAPLTALGEKALADMRKRTNIYPDGVTQAAEPKPLSAQERLAEEVKADWKALSSDQFRKKMNANAAYRKMYEELANSNHLESAVTTSHQIAEITAFHHGFSQ